MKTATLLEISTFPPKGTMTILDMQRNSCRISQDHGFWDLYDTMENVDGSMDDEPTGVLPVILSNKLMLIVSEVSEAEEALRHNKPIPEFAEELADAVIRIGDLAHKLGINLEAAIAAKQAYNETRPHMHGKRF